MLVLLDRCLEPNWPLFLKVKPSNSRPFSIKTKDHLGSRVHMMYFFHFREIHISSMRSLGFSSPGVDAKVDEGTTPWWQALGHQGWLSKRGGVLHQAILGSWWLGFSGEFVISKFSVCLVIFSGDIVHLETSMNSICIPTIYPQITKKSLSNMCSL